jgi:tetratricopeptide (TPR) repeat protein
VRTYFVLCLCTVLLGQVVAMPARAADDPATAQARQHYLKAQKAYDLGRWDEAIAEYEEAYSLRSDPTFLYNMAQAYRRKGDAQRALDLFKNYLVKAPYSPQRADIEERIRSLKKQLEQEQTAKKPGESGTNGAAATAPAAPLPVAPAASPMPPAAATPVIPVAAPTAPLALAPSSTVPVEPQTVPSAIAAATAAPVAENRSLRLTGLVLGGVGLVAVVGGAVMGLQAKSLSDQLTSDAKKQPVGAFDKSKYDSGKTAETLQWVGYGVGAAALIGGSILYWLGMPKGAEQTTTQTSITMLPYASANSVGGHLFVGF